MLHLILLSSMLFAVTNEWRSPEFQKAKAEVDMLLDKENGNGNAAIYEVTRIGENDFSAQLETRGEGAWVLNAFAKDDPEAHPKAVLTEKFNIDSFVIQTKPINSKFQVPAGEKTLVFVMTTKRYGQRSWEKLLPKNIGESKVFVFYVPSHSK